jgi:AcrR family transcriptional regulator
VIAFARQGGYVEEMASGKKIAVKAATRSRGRQPTFNRDEAIAIALDLFWRCGYEGVSVADLTSAIGIAAPSLYHAFGSKAELYREVLRHYNGMNGMGLSASVMEDAPTSYEAVRRALEHGIASVTKKSRPAGCMVSSGMLMTSPDHAELAAEVRAERAAFRVSLEGRVRRDIASGVLSAEVDAAGLARFYASVLQGMSVQAIDGASAAELAEIMKHALDAWPGR